MLKFLLLNLLIGFSSCQSNPEDPDASRKYYQIRSAGNHALYLTTEWRSGLSPVTLEVYIEGDPELNEGKNSPKQGWQLSNSDGASKSEWTIYSSSTNNNALTKRRNWGANILYNFIALGEYRYMLKDSVTSKCVTSRGVSRGIVQAECSSDDENQQFIFTLDK